MFNHTQPERDATRFPGTERRTSERVVGLALERPVGRHFVGACEHSRTHIAGAHPVGLLVTENAIALEREADEYVGHGELSGLAGQVCV